MDINTSAQPQSRGLGRAAPKRLLCPRGGQAVVIRMTPRTRQAWASGAAGNTWSVWNNEVVGTLIAGARRGQAPTRPMGAADVLATGFCPVDGWIPWCILRRPYTSRPVAVESDLVSTNWFGGGGFAGSGGEELGRPVGLGAVTRGTMRSIAYGAAGH